MTTNRPVFHMCHMCDTYARHSRCDTCMTHIEDIPCVTHTEDIPYVTHMEAWHTWKIFHTGVPDVTHMEVLQWQQTDRSCINVTHMEDIPYMTHMEAWHIWKLFHMWHIWKTVWSTRCVAYESPKRLFRHIQRLFWHIWRLFWHLSENNSSRTKNRQVSSFIRRSL